MPLANEKFIEEFGAILCCASAEIGKLELADGGNTVIIHYSDTDYTRPINIACNSRLQIIADVVKACL